MKWNYLSYGIASQVLDSWIIMIILGAVHTQTAAVPALGYWTVFGLSWVAGIVIGGSIISAWFAIRDVWSKN